MKFNLVQDWRAVIRKAWSIRLILIAGFFSGLEAGVQILSALGKLPAWMPSGAFAALAFVASNGAFVTRLMAQKGLTDGCDK